MKHALPIASVIMYASSADTSSASTGHTTVIPRGYAPCDGGTYTSRKGINIVTPDLRGRFVVGSKYTSAAGANLVTAPSAQILWEALVMLMEQPRWDFLMRVTRVDTNIKILENATSPGQNQGTWNISD